MARGLTVALAGKLKGLENKYGANLRGREKKNYMIEAYMRSPVKMNVRPEERQ